MKKMTRTISLMLLPVIFCFDTVVFASADNGEVYGIAQERLQACDSNGHSALETVFGDFMADAMCYYSGAEIGLLPSRDIGNHLQPGDIRIEDLELCLMNNSEIATVDMTAAELTAALEYSISFYELNEDQTVNWTESETDGFLQISGINVIYDLLAPVGERVIEIKTENGQLLNRKDNETCFKVVSTADFFAGIFGNEIIEGAQVIGDETSAAVDYIMHLQKVNKPDNTSRIEMLGLRPALLSNGRMIGMLILVVGFLAFAFSLKMKKTVRKGKADNTIPLTDKSI